MTAPVLEASRDFNATTPVCVLKKLLPRNGEPDCPMTGTQTCPSDPKEQEKCPAC
ncbi:hypothetical protein [Amycolatopsis sp. WAC 04182]|uniref:hypothetical protein n=1 Tax=Amycolatopsis sp. WAC 04182 TaxID=2203198 RepID=UPI0013154020|nr:hypothetical protein [Amycolatopsis sp. WAC 04182]